MSDHAVRGDERIVRCPACAERTIYSSRNRFRPFCSARCKGLDLGAWASEHFRVPDGMPGACESSDGPELQ